MDLRLMNPRWMVPQRGLRRDAIDIQNAVWFDLTAEWEDWSFYQPERWHPEDEMLLPFMMYGWPLPDFQGWPEAINQDIQDAYASVMVAHREVDDEEDGYYLMLTGGGMDFSWDIAFGYMASGYLPPAVLRLPEFAGLAASRRNQWIARGLTMSQRIHGVNASIVAKTAAVLKGAVPPASWRRVRLGG